MESYLWIGLGGALGSILRFWCSGWVARIWGETFPWGTWLVNVSGSLVIGIFAALTGPDSPLLVSPTARQFVMLGICGGFTTFSSFSLQTLLLLREGNWAAATANVFLSVVSCMVAVWLGHALGSAWVQIRR